MASIEVNSLINSRVLVDVVKQTKHHTQSKFYKFQGDAQVPLKWDTLI